MPRRCKNQARLAKALFLRSCRRNVARVVVGTLTLPRSKKGGSHKENTLEGKQDRKEKDNQVDHVVSHTDLERRKRLEDNVKLRQYARPERQVEVKKDRFRQRTS